MYVLSGGVTEVIETALEHAFLSVDNSSQLRGKDLFDHFGVKVLSNSFVYERQENVVTGQLELQTSDYNRTILHSMNKKGYIYHHAKDLRRNVILMGDIIEDSFMASDDMHDTILSIGFLNDMETNGHLLPKYMETFDIVVSGDGPLSAVNLILEHLNGSDV